MIDSEVLDQIRRALEETSRVDARRISVEAGADRVVLRGSVSTPEEASAAALVAQHYADAVDNQLQVDTHLREGVVEPTEAERAVPAENEVLIGDVDMLSGPDATTESDMSRAFEENLPWEPPTEPQLAPTDAEYGGAASEGGPEPIDESDPDPDEVSRADYAAADLTREDLSLPPERVPALDPHGVEPPALAEPDPVGVDRFGSTPPEDLEPMVEQVPGTPPGPGATGEGTAGGGSISGVPATETGARGADTASADPTRSGTGGTMTDSGTARGPEAREDEPLREDFPSAEPPDER